MWLKNLKLNNFRNHDNIFLPLSETVYIEGSNGSGKTSILEAVYLMLAMKSFKLQPVSSMVKFESDYLRIESDYYDETDHNILYFYDNKRTLKIDGDKYEKVTDHIYNFPVFSYSPEGTSILSKEQRERRSFIDKTAFYVNKDHLDNLFVYRRLIAQKSAEFAKEKINKIFIETINDQLVNAAKKISEKRDLIVKSINNYLEYFYSESSQEIFTLEYRTNVNDTDILEQEFDKRKCLYGIHRDRFYSYDKRRIYDKFSSFGQRKTFILSVLYGALKMVEEKRKSAIIVLLDDFEAGLDAGRIDRIKDIFCSERQVLITGVNNYHFREAEKVSL